MSSKEKFEIDPGYYWISWKKNPREVGRLIKTNTEKYWLITGFHTKISDKEVEVLSRQLLFETQPAGLGS